MRARANVVLPAPRSPESAMTSPGRDLQGQQLGERASAAR